MCGRRARALLIPDGACEVEGLRGRGLKLLLVVVSLLVGLSIVEVGLRVAGYTYPVFYTTDPERGYALRPHMQGWYRREGQSYVRINSEGLRDGEHTRAKPPHTLRIAILGDSYAEALQVEQESAFWSILEGRLKDCPRVEGKRVEVINFGVSGYGTAQELITLRTRVWDYSPDVVLLAVTTNNDITDNLRELKKTDEIPYYVLRDGQLQLDDSFRRTRAFRLRSSALNRAGRFIRDNVRVIQAIHQAHGAFRSAITRWRDRPGQAPAPRTPAAATGGADGRATADTNTGGEEIGVDHMVYRPPADRVWTEAWEVTERLLVEMRDEVQRHRAKFYVATLSNAIQVHRDARARRMFAERLGTPDLLYPELRLKALGEREGFTVFNLAPELQLYAEQHQTFLHGSGAQLGNGHWNAEGHRVAGELLAVKLCAALAD